MKHVMNMFRSVICCALIAQLAGCGTLIYPERRGQQHGRIDPAIAILDGIGLLLFVIPGLVAFAIDFSTGAIYLPGSVLGSLDRNTMKVITFDPQHTTAADIEEMIWKETGRRVTLHQADMEVSRLGSVEGLSQRFAETLSTDRRLRVAFNTK